MLNKRFRNESIKTVFKTLGMHPVITAAPFRSPGTGNRAVAAAEGAGAALNLGRGRTDPVIFYLPPAARARARAPHGSRQVINTQIPM
ncbi:hypothetical protein J6590_017325 [Homalodisca vitripennis]|nr:hypothetical protein J6590_017325 [Homalodisca vitripennis]